VQHGGQEAALIHCDSAGDTTNPKR
jgi:hypothetical protein